MDAAMLMNCGSDGRIGRVRAGPRNGIDYLEVERNHRVLNVYLFHEAPQRITTANVRISGGVRARDIKVLDLRIGEPGGAVGDARLQVVVDRPGDLSTYRLSLVETDPQGVSTGRPMAEFDPFYAAMDFVFHERRSTSIDCKTAPVAAPIAVNVPDINYLAKDYASFRQLILDRLALTMPQWTETHVPDIGIALVEILAYVGDYLSYYQDAVATEAYLNTARKRISVRRHLRLLDYRMHDGCNGRTWVCLSPPENTAQATFDADSIVFFAADEPLSKASIASLASGKPALALNGHVDVFEPVLPGPIQVMESHVLMNFYCWGNGICRLPAGATRATLRDAWDGANPPERTLKLQVGDFLCLEQFASAATPQSLGVAASCHVVRLTRLEAATDALFDPPVPVVNIEWAQEDALPFAMQLSQIGPDCALIENMAAACGNVCLVDEGVRILAEDLGAVPPQVAGTCCAGIGVAVSLPPSPGIFQVALSQPGLIFAQSVGDAVPASGLLDQDPALALPWIRLTSIPGTPDGSAPLFDFSDLQDSDALISRLLAPPDAASWFLRSKLSPDTRAQLGARKRAAALPAALRAQIVADLRALVREWTPKLDLLASRAADLHFVVELDDGGYANLRFGDGVMGRAPDAGETFMATYRIGLDTAGHAGADAITCAVMRPGPPAAGEPGVRNPVAAQGRVAPQSIDEARSVGPGSTAALARAVTADDYAELAERNSKVQRAAAVLLWTGSGYEARVAIDPLGPEAVDNLLLQAIRVELEPFRSIGHDLTVVPATYVPIDLRLLVHVLAGHSRAHVQSALLDAFSNRLLPDGSKGFFHPDNLSFGDDLEAGHIMAAAQALPGVQSVEVKRLKRLFEDAGQQMQADTLTIGPMEVARLDNLASQPENGRLVIDLRGGQ
ncbi:MAG TPA: hypothetical protein VKG63_07390 [Steroidobacteraceae bacterium]|nr:hypothetical protein [Steroidobacteraceae bacterium]